MPTERAPEPHEIDNFVAVPGLLLLREPLELKHEFTTGARFAATRSSSKILECSRASPYGLLVLLHPSEFEAFCTDAIPGVSGWLLGFEEV